MTASPRSAALLDVLREARALLARPANDFIWSSWTDAAEACAELDGLLARLESGELPRRLDLEVLFAPTGPMQEVSLPSGWADAFIALATRFDAAVRNAYGS
jgi:hypothetical protein